jgi:hypothetical protein
MTKDKLIELLRFYQTKLKEEAYEPSEYDSYTKKASSFHSFQHLDHALWMCEEATGLVSEGKIDKANRWLGFVQGVLFLTGKFTLKELRDQTREE